MKTFTGFNVTELSGISLISDLTDIDNPAINNSQYIYNNQQNYFIKGRPSDAVKKEFKRVTGLQLSEEHRVYID